MNQSYQQGADMVQLLESNDDRASDTLIKSTNSRQSPSLLIVYPRPDVKKTLYFGEKKILYGEFFFKNSRMKIVRGSVTWGLLK